MLDLNQTTASMSSTRLCLCRLNLQIRPLFLR